MDVLLLPTAGTIYTNEAVEADPVRLNTNLGYYTNFVNLLDLAAIAVPAGFRPRRAAVRRLADRPGVLRRGAARAGATILDGERAARTGTRRAVSPWPWSARTSRASR